MRSRFLLGTATIAVVTVAIFGTASGLLFARMVRSEARVRLEEQANALAVALSNQAIFVSGQITAEQLSTFIPEGVAAVVTDAEGNKISAGTVPDHAQQVSAPGPARSEITVLGDAGPVERRIRSGWWKITLIGVMTVAGAIVMGVLMSRRLSRPLQVLAKSAAQLSADDFSTTAPRAGITEVDAIAEALDHSATELAAMVRREREFSANASHQLRGPLTAMAMRLELIATSTDADAASEANAALDELHGLDQRIDSLLRFARTGQMEPRTSFDLVQVVRSRVEAARPALAAAGRTLRLNTNGGVRITASVGAVGEVVDILIDNALRHGHGTVGVDVRTEVSDDGLTASIDVADEGRFSASSPSSGHGVGLVLARSLLRPDGGTIELVDGAPTRFRVRLPNVPPGFTAP